MIVPDEVLKIATAVLDGTSRSYVDAAEKLAAFVTSLERAAPFRPTLYRAVDVGTGRAYRSADCRWREPKTSSGIGQLFVRYEAAAKLARQVERMNGRPTRAEEWNGEDPLKEKR